MPPERYDDLVLHLVDLEKRVQILQDKNIFAVVKTSIGKPK
jgi:hypothetical protein